MKLIFSWFYQQIDRTLAQIWEPDPVVHAREGRREETDAKEGRSCLLGDIILTIMTPAALSLWVLGIIETTISKYQSLLSYHYLTLFHPWGSFLPELMNYLNQCSSSLQFDLLVHFCVLNNVNSIVPRSLLDFTHFSLLSSFAFRSFSDFGCSAIPWGHDPLRVTWSIASVWIGCFPSGFPIISFTGSSLMNVCALLLGLWDDSPYWHACEYAAM